MLFLEVFLYSESTKGTLAKGGDVLKFSVSPYRNMFKILGEAPLSLHTLQNWASVAPTFGKGSVIFVSKGMVVIDVTGKTGDMYLSNASTLLLQPFFRHLLTCLFSRFNLTEALHLVELYTT